VGRSQPGRKARFKTILNTEMKCKEHRNCALAFAVGLLLADTSRCRQLPQTGKCRRLTQEQSLILVAPGAFTIGHG
jgi:hypothetical protein